ncbi:MAG: DUF1579 family protein [Bacteroidia bacterium]|nr:DUF1579 family protein [Bacteroidia bacterium]
MNKLIIFLLSITPFVVLSQSVNRPPERMKMLLAFNGEWKGELAEVRNGKKVKTKISHTSAKIAAGWGVMVQESAMIPEFGKYVSARIFSYSSSGDTTYMYVVDNRGDTWFYTGTWKSTRKLELESLTDLPDGRKQKKSVKYDFISLKEYEYRFMSAIGDSVISTVEMSMKKQ